jgi:ferredoxin
MTDGDGQVSGLECLRMELGRPDESGRRRPVPVEGSEFVLEADTVITAISQSPDFSGIAGFDFSPWGTLSVNEETLVTNRSGIFAGGDAVTGPKTVVDAMAQGKRAAIAIDRYLREGDAFGPCDRHRASRPPETLSPATPSTEAIPLSRAPMPKRPPEERRSIFDEVETGLTEEMVTAEAGRCLNCGICSECGECVRACEMDAIRLFEEPEEIDLTIGAIIGDSPYGCTVSQAIEIMADDRLPPLPFPSSPIAQSTFYNPRALCLNFGNGPLVFDGGAEAPHYQRAQHSRNPPFVVCRFSGARAWWRKVATPG